MLIRLGTVWLIAGFLALPCAARTIYVNGVSGNDGWTGLCEVWNGTVCGPKRTIQAGIDIAVPGDLVAVAPATYTGAGNKNLMLYGRAITVRAIYGPETCIIDCEEEGRAFTLENGETINSVIDGFTITNGRETRGGGAWCYFSNPTFINCVFTGNRAVSDGGLGGAVYAGPSSARFINCHFIENSSALHGGALFGYIATLTITGCTFADNSAAGTGAAMCFMHGASTMTNSIVTGNDAGAQGGGVCCESGGLTVINCLVTGNAAAVGGGASFNYTFVRLVNSVLHGNRATAAGGGMSVAYNGRWLISNSVIWENEAPQGPQITIGTGALLEVSHTNLEGGEAGIYLAPDATLDWGAGMIDADPLFTAPGYWDNAGTPGDPSDDVWISGDYHLLPGSPCVDAGLNSAVAAYIAVDLDGYARFVDCPYTPDTGTGAPPIVDLGAYELWHDCNENGIPDHEDLAAGTSLDLNSNGIPDECEIYKLNLRSDGECFSEEIVVAVHLGDIEEIIVGGQFFLAYDTARLGFVSIEPGDADGTDPDNPFEREIYELVDETRGHIDYAVGIPDGATGTTAPVVMAWLTFAVVADDCEAHDLLAFREHYPITRLARELGLPVIPACFNLPVAMLDISPPQLEVPPDVFRQPGEPTDPEFTGQAGATDSCDPDPLVVHQDAVAGNQIIRTWTATDLCGNVSEGVQTITIGLRGDLNCDGLINAFDIDPFVLALTAPEEYALTFPECSLMLADVNCDGLINAFDIDPFVVCLLQGGCAPCP